MLSRPKPRILIVATSSIFVRVFLEPQVRFLKENGFEVSVACGRDGSFKELRRSLPVHVLGLPLTRTLNPLIDLFSLVRLLGHILWLKPAIIHTHTPKAGLIGMMAARMAGVSHRVHTFHGLRSETLNGRKCAVVKAMEKLTVGYATRVLAVSNSLRQVIIREGISPSTKVSVLGKGSCSGIDLDTFSCGYRTPSRTTFRQQHRIPSDSLLITYVGRIAKDKGVETLAKAWGRIKEEHPSAYLLIAGPTDSTDPVSPDVVSGFLTDARIRYLEGFTEHAATMLAATDIAVQPSYREGLGVAALEASAMGVPVVACRTTGSVDAVISGQTGLLADVSDPDDLSLKIGTLLKDWEMRITLGIQGRLFVTNNFNRADVLHHLLDFYRSLRGRASLGKRILDVSLAIAGLLVSTPLIAVAALAIRIKMGSPILFRQQRAGLNGKPFTLLKLRTMHLNRSDSAGRDDARRLTWLGRWLRKMSIDEIPQLVNVLKGEMSLVGPRPLLVEYLPRYSPLEMRRHEVLPGITGWTQIKGRNHLSWEEKFALDLWYVEHQCMELDLGILLQTIQKIARSSDVTPRDCESVREFMGSQFTPL